MEYFASDNEFWCAFGRLRVLHGPSRWQETDTRDEYAASLARRFRTPRWRWVCCIKKLSRQSRERMLYLILDRSPQLLAPSDKVLQKERYEICREVLMAPERRVRLRITLRKASSARQLLC